LAPVGVPRTAKTQLAGSAEALDGGLADGTGGGGAGDGAETLGGDASATIVTGVRAPERVRSEERGGRAVGEFEESVGSGSIPSKVSFTVFCFSPLTRTLLF
jgi:hypothetical protein